MIPGPRPSGGDHRPPGSRGEAPDDGEPAVRGPVPVLFPPEVLPGPAGGPAALVVRTTRGWAVLGGARPDADPDDVVDGLTLVEAMTLADLVASELGAGPEPDRATRRSARTATRPADGASEETVDPRDHEIAGLRRTVSQLEHALAARVSIERAIGVLAERQGTSPREAFEELRGQARSQGRPATELAGEVLAGLPAAPGPRDEETAGRTAEAGTTPPEQHPESRPEQARGRRDGRERPADGDAVTEAQS